MKIFYDLLEELHDTPAYSDMSFGELIGEISYIADGHTDSSYITNEQFNETILKVLVETKNTGKRYVL